MQVTIRLFAGLRERAGAPTLVVEVPETGTVADLLDALEGTPLGGMPDRSFIVAVNRTYADRAVPVRSGDEVALIPPVSGGSGVVRRALVKDGPLDGAALMDVVRDPAAGAVVLFEGDTRNVTHLEYEAYAEMAEPMMVKIATEEAERCGLCAVAIEHRIGTVPLSEAAVLVAVAAPHRAEAFDGAKAIMDRLKAEAPIFKREEGAWIGELPARSD
jgi:molybdopterin synthase catalytic subunit